MKNITILGCGLSGMAFIRKAKELDTSAKFTIIDKNPYAFDRWGFFDDFSTKNRIDLNTFSKEMGAEFVYDTVERINPQRHKIYFKDKECRDYETLILTSGVKPKKIVIKGEHREGFFYLSGFDPLVLRDRIKILSDCVVYVSTFLGVKLALYLRAQKKDVNIVAGNLDFLGDRKEQLLTYCAREKIGVYAGSTIEEAIGEATVRAVKLNPLKVLSAQALFVDSGFLPNVDFFETDESEGPALGHKDIFIIGSAADKGIESDFFFVDQSENSISTAMALAENIFTEHGQRVDFTRKKEYNPQLIIDELFSRFNVNAGIV
jgi:thioredoxin reductase